MVWLVVFAGVLAAGCSLDYGDAALDEEFDAELPEAELGDAVVTAVREDGEIRIVAERVQYFPSKQEQRLAEVRFEEISRDGTVVTEGRSGHARIFTDSDNVEFWDDVRLYSHEQRAWIYAEFLRYDHEARVVSGRPDERVSIEKDDGSVVSGLGFSAELELRDISFGADVRGTLVSSDDDDENDDEDRGP